MLTVDITYHAETRLMEVTSVSTGMMGKAIATTGDDMMTRLQFTFDDPDDTLEGYDMRVDFRVNVVDDDGHAYNPYLPLDENGYVVLPSSILSNVKCSELPIQLAFTKVISEDEKLEFHSLNVLELGVNRAIDSSAEIHDRDPSLDEAIYHVAYNPASATFTFTQLDGTHITIHLSDLAEDHYEVATRTDLVTLSEAERGDTATALDTGVWYKLYGSYDDLTKWYAMSGNATVNGVSTGTPMFYAPHSSGIQNQVLVSDGQSTAQQEHPPVWTTLSRKYILNFTPQLKDIDVPNIMGTDDVFCKFKDANGNDITLEYFTQTKNDVDYITVSTNLSEAITMLVFAIPYVSGAVQ